MPDDILFLGGAIGSILLFAVIPTVLLGLAVPYVVLRLREGRSGEYDSHIGVKAGLHFFISAGIILMLIGLTVVFVDLFTREDRVVRNVEGRRIGPPADDSRDLRTGFALLTSGAAVTLIHGLLLTATNDSRLRAARRAFTGTRFAITGLVVVVTLTWLFVTLFKKSVDFKEVKPILAVLLVWVPAWIVHMVLLMTGTPQAPTRESVGLPGYR